MLLIHRNTACLNSIHELAGSVSEKRSTRINIVVFQWLAQLLKVHAE
jgi:hypothetical protein